jgi:hypothetical protein
MGESPPVYGAGSPDNAGYHKRLHGHQKDPVAGPLR